MRIEIMLLAACSFAAPLQVVAQDRWIPLRTSFMYGTHIDTASIVNLGDSIYRLWFRSYVAPDTVVQNQIEVDCLRRRSRWTRTVIYRGTLTMPSTDAPNPDAPWGEPLPGTVGERDVRIACDAVRRLRRGESPE